MKKLIEKIIMLMSIVLISSSISIKQASAAIKNISRDKIIYFRDVNLEKAVRIAIEKPEMEIYQSEVEIIKELNLENKNIKNVSGIENLRNMEKLNLSHNEISNVSPLEKLSALKELDISYTKVRNKDVIRLKHCLPNCKFLKE